MPTLEGRVAIVTGGSRSVGYGIAAGLCEAGATVYVTGRTITDRTAARLAGFGGRAVALPCDHDDDAQVQAAFDGVAEREGRLDVLVNNAWGGYRRLRNRKAFPGYAWKAPFWEQPLEIWDEMFRVGVRSSYVASAIAARTMLRQGSGLIVSISFYAGRRYTGNVPYGVAKAATDRLAEDMAVELRPHGVASVALYPGHVIDAKTSPKPKRESAQFVGRAVAALAADPDVLRRSGKIQVVAELAREYGFTDTDGTQPEPVDEL